MYSSDLSKIINDCLKKDYQDRPTIQQILENPKLIEEASKLGYEIPSFRQLSDDIKEQKKELLSTFNKKKKVFNSPQPSSFYKRTKTSAMAMKYAPARNVESRSKPIITSSSHLNMMAKNKANIDLISSEI